MTITQQNAITDLKKLGIKRGDFITCSIVSVSRSGMSRKIKFLISGNKNDNGRILNISRLIAEATNNKFDNNTNSISVRGAGMDMGFYVIYSLSGYMFNDGYAIKHNWL